MGSPNNPMMGQVMAALQGRTQGGTTPPGQAPGQAASMDAGGEYAQQQADLRGADPNSLLRQLKAMKSICAVMLVQNLERLPNVAGKLSKMIPQFDAVIKEVQQASSVQGAVRPISMGAAQPGEPPQQGMGG